MSSNAPGYTIDWVFTEAARDVMAAEGMQAHSIGPAPFPTLPIAGDLIAWDWLAGSRPFLVTRREFIWSDPQNLSVRFLLDLPR